MPSEEWPDARSALQSLLVDAVSIRAAVAFVTGSGVDLIEQLLEHCPDAGLEVVARGSDATEPDALLRLGDRPNTEVSVAMGRFAKPFHPKLWLIETADELRVLSGSGNLTASGLTTNEEQFEVLRMSVASDLAEAQGDRFDQLTRNAQPLESIVDSPVWREWLELRKQQDRARRQIAHIERRYFEREPVADRSADKVLLIEDLQGVYDRTVEANLERRDGQQYYPTRLLVGINRCRRGEQDPVRLVANVVKQETEGLNIIREAGLIELTLEWLVVDEAKSYHSLFLEKTVRIARERIDAFGAGD